MFNFIGKSGNIRRGPRNSFSRKGKGSSGTAPSPPGPGIPPSSEFVLSPFHIAVLGQSDTPLGFAMMGLRKIEV